MTAVEQQTHAIDTRLPVLCRSNADRQLAIVHYARDNSLAVIADCVIAFDIGAEGLPCVQFCSWSR